MASRALRDLVSGLADQHQIFYLITERLNPLVILAVLVVAACNEDSRSRHCADGLDRRVRIGSLGIVVIADTGALQHELNAVLYSLELFYGFADQIHRHTHADAHGYRCHHVLIVVFAEKLHIRLYV